MCVTIEIMKGKTLGESTEAILEVTGEYHPSSISLTKGLSRQKIILQKRQLGVSTADILTFLRKEHPNLLTPNYSQSHVTMDLYRSLATLIKEIKPLADSYLVSELVQLDTQEQETRDVIDMLKKRIDDAVENNERPESTVDRWIKAQTLRLNIGDRRNLLLNVAVPKVTTIEERSVNISLDDYNNAKRKLKNIVRVEGKHKDSGEIPPVIVNDAEE
jgi:DNA-binding transcriptional MerR regulator